LLRVLEQEPNHTGARELLGEVLLEVGDIEAAKQTFGCLLPPSPYAPLSPSSSAHLNLAQLCGDPRESLSHYQSAVDILLSQLKGKERAVTEEDVESEPRSKAVSAIVAMVEIWMSDLCFEEEAESSCDRLALLALRTDPNSSEALQTLASVRLSQKRPDEALQLAEQAWGQWKDLDPESPKIPSLPARLSLTRLFLELSLYTNALTILSGILGIDDQEVEAWYLEGWCLFLMAEQARETKEKVSGLTWEELAKDAMDCLETCQMLHQAQNHPDEQILQHAKDLIIELVAAGIQPTAEEEAIEENGDDDDNWEDEDEDVEMD